VTGLAHRYIAASGGGAAINTYSFDWDNASQLTSETSIDGVVNYTYDNSSQLTGVTGARTEAYAYDNTGNRNTAGNTTTTDNRLASDGTFNYGYDDEGNLTTKTKISNGEVTTFVWDYRNRLTSAVKKTSGGTTLSTSTYKYDLFDHRIERNENGTILRTVYDGGNAWSDFNGSNTQTVRYLYGRALDQLYARVDATNNVAFYLTDYVGSVRDIVTPTGALLDHVKYDSFGNILFESAPAAGDRFKYTAREYDAAANLYYYRARYYDGGTGRFIGQDPVKFAAGDTNLQRYVGNRPATATDPTGLDEYGDAIWAESNRRNQQEAAFRKNQLKQPLIQTINNQIDEWHRTGFDYPANLQQFYLNNHEGRPCYSPTSRDYVDFSKMFGLIDEGTKRQPSNIDYSLELWGFSLRVGHNKGKRSVDYLDYYGDYAQQMNFYTFGGYRFDRWRIQLSLRNQELYGIKMLTVSDGFKFNDEGVEWWIRSFHPAYNASMKLWWQFNYRENQFEHSIRMIAPYTSPPPPPDGCPGCDP
jgi:RHS repeat-associated protein